MLSLKGTRTGDNLKEAFAKEARANRRYLYYAEKAKIEGFHDISDVFRTTANRKTGHAHGHLEFLEEVGDPDTGAPIGTTPENEPESRCSRQNKPICRPIPEYGQDGAGRRI